MSIENSENWKENLDRFWILCEALASCTASQNQSKAPIFNTWERIWINQERGRLLQNIGGYEQDLELEYKIQKTRTII